jgi:hypothetical protein
VAPACSKVLHAGVLDSWKEDAAVEQSCPDGLFFSMAEKRRPTCKVCRRFFCGVAEDFIRYPDEYMRRSAGN